MKNWKKVKDTEKEVEWKMPISKGDVAFLKAKYFNPTFALDRHPRWEIITKVSSQRLPSVPISKIVLEKNISERSEAIRVAKDYMRNKLEDAESYESYTRLT